MALMIGGRIEAGTGTTRQERRLALMTEAGEKAGTDDRRQDRRLALMAEDRMIYGRRLSQEAG